LCTGCGEHLTRAAAHTAAIAKAFCSSILPATGASFGFIGIALGCKKLLLFTGKGERFPAIGTLERFLLE